MTMAFFSFFKKKKDIKKEESVENKVVESKDNAEEISESDSDEIQQKRQKEQHEEAVSALESVGAGAAAAEFFDDTVNEKDLKQEIDKDIKKESTRAESSFVIYQELEAEKRIIADDESFKSDNNEIEEKKDSKDKDEIKEDKSAVDESKVFSCKEEASVQDVVKPEISDKDESERLESQNEEQDVIEVKTEPKTSEENKEISKKNEKVSFFERLKRTRENIAMGLSSFMKGRKIDEDLYEELETALLTADLGVETTNLVIEKLREESKLRELHDAVLLKKNLKDILKNILKPCELPLDVTGKRPFVILMVGVNGAGKTTTIGKLARKYQDQGLKVMLAAGDTFRAAAVEQLKEWGNRANVPVIAQATGSDSASVLFDAVNAAKARNIDVLICDTAGRLQNKDNLMEELKKIVRVMKKIDEEVPHEVLLVLDATTGQNAVSQATLFGKAVPITGICLTKLDGTAKGGVIFTLADKFKLPIRYIGIGEKAEDLRPFKADVFVDALFKDED